MSLLVHGTQGPTKATFETGINYYTGISQTFQEIRTSFTCKLQGQHIFCILVSIHKFPFTFDVHKNTFKGFFFSVYLTNKIKYNVGEYKFPLYFLLMMNVAILDTMDISVL